MWGIWASITKVLRREEGADSNLPTPPTPKRSGEEEHRTLFPRISRTKGIGAYPIPPPWGRGVVSKKLGNKRKNSEISKIHGK